MKRRLVFCVIGLGLLFAMVVSLGSCQTVRTESPPPSVEKVDIVPFPSPVYRTLQTAANADSTPVAIHVVFKSPEAYTNIGKFLLANWLATLVLLLGIVEVVVRLTPSEKDNSVFNFIYGWIDRFIPNLKTGGQTHPPVKA
jgi:hypothetical protein